MQISASCPCGGTCYTFKTIYPFEEMCATHTHQLALDMQLSLVAPPLVYLLFLSQGWGILLIATLQVISVALRYYVSVQDKLSPLLYNGITLSPPCLPGPLQKQTTREPLLPGHVLQCVSSPQAVSQGVIEVRHTYLVELTFRSRHCLTWQGLSLAQHQPASQKGQKELNNKIIPHLVYGGWLSAAYLIYFSFFSMSEVVSPEYQYDAFEISFYYALSPVAMSLALSWVILACATRNGELLKMNNTWFDGSCDIDIFSPSLLLEHIETSSGHGSILRWSWSVVVGSVVVSLGLEYSAARIVKWAAQFLLQDVDMDEDDNVPFHTSFTATKKKTISFVVQL
uniref:Uncharacterized protein n=1 Tax=Timema cristinae TaxID=61476 RepID=A0A7R9D7E4_TIMCR|nr:unnamed protein product [Timema cristinae]